MIHSSRLRFVLALSLWTATAGVAAQEPPERRVALVIAVELYDRHRPSPQAEARGARLAAGLAALGFTVETSRGDRDAAIRAAIRRFAAAARQADVAVVALVGHVASARGESFLLPGNAMVERATDLPSRGVSISSLAAMAAQAAQGGVVLTLATSPDIASTVPDVTARPAHDRPAPPQVGLAYASSPRTPVSAVTGAAAEAFDRLDAALDAPVVTAAALIAAAGQAGMMVGEAPAVVLRAPAPEPALAPEPLPVAAPETAAPAAAPPEPQASTPAPAGEAPPEPEAVSIEALQLVESMLAAPQKRLIQRRLRDRGHYAGAIDAAFGPRTRAAIAAFQQELGAAPTGFLTPGQIETLLAP